MNYEKNRCYDKTNEEIIGMFISLLLILSMFLFIYIEIKLLKPNQQYKFDDFKVEEILNKKKELKKVQEENKEKKKLENKNKNTNTNTNSNYIINIKKNKKFIILDSKIVKPSTYELKNKDILNLYKINSLILNNKKITLEQFDNNQIVKDIKNGNNYLSLKHIINLENMFLLNISLNEIRTHSKTLNSEVSKIIKEINIKKEITQKKKETLFNDLYDKFDKRFDDYQSKLLKKYNNDDEDDDILFIQNNINEIKFFK